MSDTDFGTYHHTTREQSKHIRECAEKAFSKLSRPLYPSRAALKDSGRGLRAGVLTYVAAKCFPKASVTGIDLFRHDSVAYIKRVDEKSVEAMDNWKLNLLSCFADVRKPVQSAKGKARKADTVVPLGMA